MFLVMRMPAYTVSVLHGVPVNIREYLIDEHF